jgi:hypothetical protein
MLNVPTRQARRLACVGVLLEGLLAVKQWNMSNNWQLRGKTHNKALCHWAANGCCRKGRQDLADGQPIGRLDRSLQGDRMILYHWIGALHRF